MRRFSQSVTLSSVLQLALATAVVSTVVVLAGGTAVWRLEGDRPGSTFRSWGDGIWWAMTTMTTVGYGDHVPGTLSGRVVAGLIMVMGVAVLGAVAAVVALIFASSVAAREERILEAEGRTLEARLEARLDVLEAHLAGIEEHLRGSTPHDDAREPRGEAQDG
jgi:voltage-gated potassium channel Kch